MVNPCAQSEVWILRCRISRQLGKDVKAVELRRGSLPREALIRLASSLLEVSNIVRFHLSNRRRTINATEASPYCLIRRISINRSCTGIETTGRKNHSAAN